MNKNPIRVLIAKVGLDGHDRGAKIIAQSLKDEGMEVIYSGLRQTPEKIVETAIQEDVHIIGISSLSGAHMHIFPPIISLLKKKEADDIIIIGGGVIPDEDIKKLKEIGVREIFTSGMLTKEIISSIKQIIFQEVTTYD